MESKQKFFKAKFRDVKKIFSFTESFQDFLKAMEISYKISLNPFESSSYSISFIDDEEDLINIENAFDFNEAIKFAENLNQNCLNFIITQNNSSFFKKDNKENFEYIESNSIRSQELQKSPQIEFLIPKGKIRSDFNTIQKLEDLKFFVEENQLNYDLKKLKSKKNFRNEDTILSKSPEISIDLLKNISNINKKENFEITYDSSNNANKKDLNKNLFIKEILGKNVVNNVNNFKLEKLKEKKTKHSKHNRGTRKVDNLQKNIDLNTQEKENLIEKENKKDIKKITKALIKKAITEEFRNFKKSIEQDIFLIISKHNENLSKKNYETQKTITEIQNSLKSFKNCNQNNHIGFSCRICKQTPILGVRYKCSVCQSFDICEKCEEKNTIDHPHPFIKIRSPDLNPSFIKTITFEDEDNKYEDYDESSECIRNVSNQEKYLEKIIDFNAINDWNHNNQNNGYNCFNINANSDILNYFKNNIKYNSNPINENVSNNSNHSSTNCNFNINNLKSSNFNNLINNTIKNNYNSKTEGNFKEDKYSITCINSNEIFEIKNSQAKEFKITLKLKNTGKNTIPRPSYLECISNISEISGKGIPINYCLKPGMCMNPEITLDISGLKKGTYLSVWRMQTSQREYFGDEIPIKIKIEKTDDLKINENFREEKINQEKINLDEVLLRNKIIDLPEHKEINNNNDNTNTKIISLEEYKKLKLLKKRNSENSENKENNVLAEKKQSVDFFTLADELIKKYPEKNIKRKELINALFRTGGNEKNSVEMAANETMNVCRHYNKHLFN